MSGRLAAIAALFLACLTSPGFAAQPTVDEVVDALGRATDFLTSISTEGGYLWRYSADLEERFGEEPARSTQVWVQPPGTPSVGMAFLAAYVATGDRRHLSAAHAAAMALVRGQLASGGWSYLIEFDPAERADWAYRSDGAGEAAQSERSNRTTFDDDTTQSALRFLMALIEATADEPLVDMEPIREAVAYGLEKMVAAQYPNGAWPQQYSGTPHEAGLRPPGPAVLSDDWPRTWPDPAYENFYTLNDEVHRDGIRTLLEAWKLFGDRRYLDAAIRGGEFLILAQLPEPQPAWAQQYDFAMEPAWARAYEPPALSSSESVSAMTALVDLYVATGDERFLRPIPAFLDWLDRSRIGPDLWARFYELGTNRPIYGDHDGRIHYALSEISRERQLGYAWVIDSGIMPAIRYYETVRDGGRERVLADEARAESRAPDDDEVALILSEQDSEGRWLSDGWIDMERVAGKIQALAAYVRHH